MKTYIQHTKAWTRLENTEDMTGADYPEDVAGAFEECLGLDWNDGSLRQGVLICDAPDHGPDSNPGFCTRFPNVHPRR